MFKRASTGYKYAYTVTFNSCSGLTNDVLASVAWKRGSKKENQGETSRKIVTEGSVEWEEAISLKCTLFKSKGSGSTVKFDEKLMIVSVCEYNMKKSKAVPLAKMSVDLSAFAGASSQTQYHKLKPIKKKGSEESDKSSEDIILTITYHSEKIGE